MCNTKIPELNEITARVIKMIDEVKTVSKIIHEYRENTRNEVGSNLGRNNERSLTLDQ
jgi:hypothetical protein